MIQLPKRHPTNRATYPAPPFRKLFEAESMFPPGARLSKRTSKPRARYQRFARAADAIRFAIEDLPPELLAGAYLEVEEERFDADGIRRLYDHAAYPLARRAATAVR